MSNRVQHEGEYFGSSDGSPHGREKDRTLDAGAPGSLDTYDNQTGEVHDPYGGKKLGMVRVCIITPNLLVMT